MVNGTAPIHLLVLLTKRQPPSSRLRFFGCFDEFRKHGVIPESLPIPSDPFGRIRMLFKARQADVVVLQKKTSLSLLELKLLRWANPRIIFDMDDAVMFHELEHQRPLTGKNVRKFLRTINHCQAVVAGNPFLARFAEPNCARVFVLPTPVDTDKYQPRDYTSGKTEVVVGWLGVSGNLRYLEQLAPVFSELARKYPQFRLKIVSNDFIEIPGVPIIKEKWTLASEQASLHSFDIGIMPLDDSLWSRGKCGYKILQYMGAGVPVVASPVGINADFLQNGEAGILASDHDSWIKALSLLISDDEARRQMGQAGREKLEENYSNAKYSINYCNIIRNLV